MCGRYGRRGDKQYIAEHYAIRKVDFGDDFPDEHPYAFATDSTQLLLDLSSYFAP